MAPFFCCVLWVPPPPLHYSMHSTTCSSLLKSKKHRRTWWRWTERNAHHKNNYKHKSNSNFVRAFWKASNSSSQSCQSKAFSSLHYILYLYWLFLCIAMPLGFPKTFLQSIRDGKHYEFYQKCCEGRATEVIWSPSHTHWTSQQRLPHSCSQGQRCFSIAKRKDGVGVDVLPLWES